MNYGRLRAANCAGAIPLGRMEEADEVAKAVLYLTSDDASNARALKNSQPTCGHMSATYETVH
jgi:hypothetical protein